MLLLLNLQVYLEHGISNTSVTKETRTNQMSVIEVYVPSKGPLESKLET